MLYENRSLDINEKGNLTVGGCDCTELAKQYGTPLYVMDENSVRNSLREFIDSIKKNYNGNGMCAYASKAMCCLEMCRIVAEEGAGLDVVSGGEIYTAAKANFPMERALFHGNNKTEGEIELAIEKGVGRIVADNIYELYTINRIAAEKNKTVTIMLRIKPGIDAHTHQFIRTGQIDSKFGFALETGEAFEAVEKAMAYSNIKVSGFHCHIGSQIFELEPFVLAAKVMVEFIEKVKNELGLITSDLDLGGGFGIRYTDEDKPRAYSEFMEPVAKEVKRLCKEKNIDIPFIIIEPGRSIAGPAGLTLYTVGDIKTIPDIRTYVSVDGGMGDNPRYILYQAKYDALIANKASQKRDFKATIAGKCCESGDLIQENAMIQAPECGDILAVLATGAYNYSMASNYNRIPKAAVVMVNEGKSRVVVKRESYEDLLRNDV